MTPFILLIPLLLAMIAIAVDRNSNDMHTRYVALGATVVSLLLLPLVSSGTQTIPWFSAGGYAFNITTTIAPINLLLLIIVLGIGPLIFFYSTGFMDKPSEQKRYYIEMLGFEAAMLTFAMAGNLILFFIAWEFLSITSYLLIGFWHKEKPARAAREAITIIAIGDLALIAAIVVILTSTGTLSISALVAGALSHTIKLPLLAVGLLILAIMTKSAQFPFQEWLSDAMEGPTPVSAFLHSTTMVKAGVFAAIILSPIFVSTNTGYVLVLIGLLTSVIALFNATREFHIKRVIAYSTIQELSLMLVAIGGGAVSAAIYFFFAQSFYKALLFFDAGIMMKATDKEDLRDISGLRSNRLIYLTTVFGVLALAGFLPFDGFFASVSLSGAFTTNLIVYAILSLIGLGTSFYAFRWMTYLARKPSTSLASVHLSAQPKSMVYSAVILAAFTLIASIGFKYLPAFFSASSSQLAYSPPAPLSLGGVALETALALIGAFAGYTIYSASRTKIRSGVANTLMYNSVIFRWLYDHAAMFFYYVAEGVSAFDVYLNEAFDVLGKDTVRSSWYIRKAAIGRINQFVLIIAIVLVLAFAYVFIIARGL